MKRTVLLLTMVVGGMLFAFGGVVLAHPEHSDGATDAEDGARDLHQHGDGAGHLPATKSDNVDLVSKLRLENVVPEKIADVGVHKGYAYLAAWGSVTCEDNGVHVVDVRDPAAPREVNFVRSKVGSYPGEGIQTVSITTPKFSGDILVSNNEKCNQNTGYGGVNLYDVTNPTRVLPLFEGAGDAQGANGVKRKSANSIHSAFAWDAGDKAYAVIVDNAETTDVDILDITDPRAPKQIADLDLAREFPQIEQSTPDNLHEVFHHDVVVKQIAGKWLMMVSYWDGGYVALNVNDPANPTYVADTDFAAVDPELLQQTGREERSEGNAHQSEFTLDNRYVLASDEDFSPIGSDLSTDDNATTVAVSQGSNTKRLGDGETLSAQAIYVGRGCTGDAAVPKAPADGGTYVAVVTRGLCPFTEKVANIEAAGGYAGAVVVNREGDCGGFGMSVKGNITVVSLDRKNGFGLFDKEAAYDDAACQKGTDTLSGSLIPGVDIGQQGDVVNINGFFDGWGYVHLYENGAGKKLQELDTYAIPEAMDPAKSTGFGDLSVHEVAVSERDAKLAYFSYYSGGFRVVRIEENEQGAQLKEVDHFIDEGGSNFWGVQTFQQGGKEYVAASDRDFGLYVFEYTGP
ncbi:MAG: hypothetical protein M3Q49_20350 [Actinomycetota bacterium]|nr:hypothetical protein [Actinomycetota bacterium]